MPLPRIIEKIQRHPKNFSKTQLVYFVGGQDKTMFRRRNSKKREQDDLKNEHPASPEKVGNLLNLSNLSLDDEAWQKIVKALAARGFPIKEEDLRSEDP